jgi:23S rRNA pseudouridine1911/1915/1917 synthase
MPSYSGIIAVPVPPGLRLDRYAAEYLGLLTRSQIKARKLAAKLNGKEVKVSREVKEGDVLELVWTELPPAGLAAENIPLRVIYEDERVVVVNKPQGMVVHPGAGNRQGTLANALLYRYGSAGGLPGGGDGAAGSLRPGIVHRLDKDTSGVIIAARDEEALRFLAGQFKKRRVRKTYAAIVRGHPPEDKGRIETFIARDLRDRKRFAVSEDRGRKALTFYRVIRRWDAYSLALLRPGTGRTHQLRVHMRWLGSPIAADPIYGGKEAVFPGAGLMLHARSLTLLLPDHEKPETFRAPVPKRFRLFMARLGSPD